MTGRTKSVEEEPRYRITHLPDSLESAYMARLDNLLRPRETAP